MTSIIKGPWIPGIDHQTVPELKATIAEQQGEIAFLLRVARAAQFMYDSLEEIASGKVLPAQNRRAAEKALRYVAREVPEVEEMRRVGL